METLFNVSLPIFAIMALGYGAGYFKLLGPGATQALNRFVFSFALPPAMFSFTAKAEFGEIFNTSFMAAYLLGMVGTVLLAFFVARYIFRLRLEDCAYHGFLGVFVNSGYMGIPIFLTAFGTDGLVPVVITNLIGPMLTLSMIMITLELLRTPGAGFFSHVKTTLRLLITNPVLIGSLTGILFSYFSLPIPVALDNFVSLLASAAGPTALFALGLSLVGHPIMGDIKEVSWLVILKLIVQPVLTFLLITWVFVADPFWTFACVIMAALPIGSTAFVISQEYDVMLRRTSAAVALSTGLSIVTLSGLMIYFDIS